MKVGLREVLLKDLPTLFEHQRDAEAAELAAFAPREWDPFIKHWTMLLSDESVFKRTVVANDEVAGNLLCFGSADEREIGYWIDRKFWGRGVASRAVGLLLEEMPARPLFARVAKHNAASIRLLIRSGFLIVGEDPNFSNLRNRRIEGLTFRLD